MPKESFTRYRFSVPNADESVNKWIDEQSNLSFSIRQIIKDYIQHNGITDATCAEVRQLPKRGRKPNSSYMMNPQDFEDVDDESEFGTEDAPVQKSVVLAEPAIVQSVVAEFAPVEIEQTPIATQVVSTPVASVAMESSDNTSDVSPDAVNAMLSMRR